MQIIFENENKRSNGRETNLIGIFLLKLKKKFGRGDKESVKVVKLKRIKQGRRTERICARILESS